MGGAYYYRDIFVLFKTMQNLESALGIQKENWRYSVTMHFSKILKPQFENKQTTTTRKKMPCTFLYALQFFRFIDHA